MGKMIELGKIAKVIRSKNAGPFLITFDIIFNDSETYGKVLKSKAIDRDVIADLYRLPKEANISIIGFSPASAIKITVPRLIASGAVGDSDIYGAQQHAPLYEIKIPWE
jgi:hypothetical protein